MVTKSSARATRAGEAAERRKAAQALDLPTELGGRDGPERRYGELGKRKGDRVDYL